jgi:hypothetical protein
MRKSVSILLLGFSLISLPVSAMTPPPLDKKNVQASRALDVLEKFLGKWRGADGQYVETRQLGRVGNSILFIITGGAPTELNVIDYNPTTRMYRLHLPGYRHTFLAPQKEAVDLRVRPPATIQWEVSQARFKEGAPHNSIRTTVSIERGRWHEKIEEVGPKGITFLSSSVFEHVGNADWSDLK